MKFSTIIALSAVSLVFLASGCKYDKAGADGSTTGDNGGNITDIPGNPIDEQTEEFNLKDIGDEKKFEDMYAKCTDVDFAPVYFGFDSAVVPQLELGKADAVVQHLKDNGNRVVVIEGNCDERGSNEYNVLLGENRATTLRNYFVNGGIDVGRIQTRSYGEEKPADEGHDETAWAKNRRGEFGIYDTNQKLAK